VDVSFSSEVFFFFYSLVLNLPFFTNVLETGFFKFAFYVRFMHLFDKRDDLMTPFSFFFFDGSCFFFCL
jgi:hypothetical protein